jgi:hypothetical protein
MPYFDVELRCLSLFIMCTKCIVQIHSGRSCLSTHISSPMRLNIYMKFDMEEEICFTLLGHIKIFQKHFTIQKSICHKMYVWQSN